MNRRGGGMTRIGAIEVVVNQQPTPLAVPARQPMRSPVRHKSISRIGNDTVMTVGPRVAVC